MPVKSWNSYEGTVGRNMDNKWDCDEDSKGNDESRTESSIFLANIHKVMNRIVVEEGTRRIILAKSQMEMRNSFEN